MGSIMFDQCENLLGEESVIASGANLATPFSTQGWAIVGVQMPAAWTAAKLGFDVSLDGISWNTAYDNGGNYEQSTVQAASFICIPLSDAIFAPFIRPKSVDASNVAVNQVAARTLKFMLRRYLGGS